MKPDDVTAGVKRLAISGKPKRKAVSKSQTERLNREEIKELNVNREYIVKNQPWCSNALPRGYLPHPATKWYPPIFCLGVALSFHETEEFAKHFGIPVDERCTHRHGISRRLTKVCGARVMVERCDMGGPPEDRTWLFSLVTNYDISRGANVNESLKKYREIVEQAFGSSKKVMWWLEYTVNHDPGNWWWSAHKPEWIDVWDPEWVYRSEDEE